MDDAVLRGMARWPSVPSVFGWLALDRRGQWLIKREHIGNPLVAEFIGRNYAADDKGQWFFQNGPQRVFVELAHTPLVYRWSATAPGAGLSAHTGAAAASASAAWIDDAGGLVVLTELGPGLVDDRDLPELAARFTARSGLALDEDHIAEALDALQAGADADIAIVLGGTRLPLGSLAVRDAPVRLGFVRHPEPPPGEEVCI